MQDEAGTGKGNAAFQSRPELVLTSSRIWNLVFTSGELEVEFSSRVHDLHDDLCSCALVQNTTHEYKFTT